MESEKIKKGLECCSMLMDNTKTAEEQDNACGECPYRENFRCSWNLDADALTLINELESENKKLKNTRVICDGTNLDYAEEDIKAEQGCNECISNHLKNFATWLCERSNNMFYMELLKEYENELI